MQSADIQLLKAAKKNDLQSIKQALEEGADINVIDKYGNAPIDITRIRSNVQATQFLIERGAKTISYKNLIKAAKNGDIATLQKAFQENINFYPVSLDQNTVLDFAITHGKGEAAQLLIERGARSLYDPQASLMYAAYNGLTYIIAHILDNYAVDINAVDTHYHVTALSSAIANGKGEAAQLLIERGARSLYDLQESFMYAVYHGLIPIIKHILDSYEVDINAIHINKGTPLDYAITSVRGKAAQFLIQRGGRLSDPQASLIEAANEGLTHIIEHILDNYSVDINAVDTNNRKTALDMAIYSGKGKAAQLLIERGAKRLYNPRESLIDAAYSGLTHIIEHILDNYSVDINAVGSYYYKTALDKVIENGHGEAAKLLIERGANTLSKPQKSLMHCAYHGLTDIIKYILKNYPVNINAADVYNGKTALDKAIKKGHGEAAKFLIQKGAKRLHNPQESLIDAAYHGLTDIIKYILDNYKDKVDINAVDSNNVETALELAINNGHGEAAQLLTERGAQRLSNPQQSFIDAAYYGFTDIMKYILDNYPIDINAVDSNNGKTALDKAIQNGHDQAAKFLIQKGADKFLENNQKQYDKLFVSGFLHTPLMLSISTQDTSIESQYFNRSGDTASSALSITASNVDNNKISVEFKTSFAIPFVETITHLRNESPRGLV